MTTYPITLLRLVNLNLNFDPSMGISQTMGPSYILHSAPSIYKYILSDTLPFNYTFIC